MDGILSNRVHRELMLDLFDQVFSQAKSGVQYLKFRRLSS